MENSVLITLPQSDSVTEYLTAFSKEILDNSEKRNIKSTCLRREKATKENFEKSIRGSHKLVVFNGHGNTQCIMGHHNKEIIKKGKNEILLKDKITYARSCWSASNLGESIVKQGNGTCFVGYNIPFMFLSDITRETTPLKDKFAKVCLETSNRFPMGIIKGQSSLKAHKNSKKAMLKEINKAISKGDKDSQAIANTLWNNYSGQILLGCETAKL
ncbi:MAG: hypothetical protein ACOC1P_03970 [Minisyncoccales bacterium]